MSETREFLRAAIRHMESPMPESDSVARDPRETLLSRVRAEAGKMRQLSTSAPGGAREALERAAKWCEETRDEHESTATGIYRGSRAHYDALAVAYDDAADHIRGMAAELPEACAADAYTVLDVLGCWPRGCRCAALRVDGGCWSCAINDRMIDGFRDGERGCPGWCLLRKGPMLLRLAESG